MSERAHLEEYGFDPDYQSRAKNYERLNLRLDIGELILAAAGVSLFALYGSRPLFTELRRLVPGFWLRNACYVTVFFLGWSILSLPLKWKSYLIERRFDLSVQKPVSWIKDQFKSGLISLLMTLVVFSGIYAAMAWSDWWWLIAWLATSLLSLLLSFIAPLVLMPLFYRFQPLKDEELAERLNRLAEQAGVEVIGAFTMEAGTKTRKAIGGLTGIGSTRRIILSDTLLNNYKTEEIETVIAHELGHHVNQDIWKRILWASATSLIAFYLTNLFLQPATEFMGLTTDIESLPIFVLLLGLIYGILNPILNWFSRKAERKADRFALELTDNPQAQADSFIKLAQQNLSPAAPPLFKKILFHDHPSPLERVKQARKFER